MILTCNNIEKSFGTTKVLENITFQINKNEKAAVVGMNGAGKSTLFKIIAGDLSPDEGFVTMSKGCVVGYLSQHEAVTSNNTIYNEMLSVKADIIKLEKDIRQLEIDLKSESGSRLEQMLDTYSNLTSKFESENGYAYKSVVVGVLKGLGFHEDSFDNLIETLSGGEKTRIALGKLLLSNPDILLLDEPTNHLDLETIDWLESFLDNYKGAVLVIAHDRYFLDKFVTKVIEIENNTSSVFNGNYSNYSIKKAKQHETMIKHYINQQKEIKRQEEVIKKLRSFNREKSIKRARSREKLLSKVKTLEKPYEFDSSMTIHFKPQITSGNDVLSVTDLSKSYDDVNLFTNINLEIKRGEHIAIIGNNGTGKSTILKVINKIIKPDTGTVRVGENVHIGYFDQEQQLLNLENTIFDEIQDQYPYLNNTSIRNVLASFLFTNDDVFKQIKDLSGGERGRVALVKLMLSEANFLIMDEPTNHLDIVSKEVLEKAINQYSGTVLYVSHDRYFINKTAHRILELTNNTIINYLGNYDYYIEKKDELRENFSIDSSSNKDFVLGDSDLSSGKLDWQKQKEKQAMERKLQKELKDTEKEITTLEKRSEEIDELLILEEIYTNVEKLVDIQNEKIEIDDKLVKLLGRWEELAEELSEDS